MEKIEKLQPRAFTRFCMTIGAVPSSYLEGMTIERQLLWFCSYLEKEVIPAVNNNAGAVEELQALYTQLKDYVDHYFDNLDVQEEINNKLDEMAEQGVLADIIAQYIQLQGVLAYNSVADMKAATNLVAGSFAETYGYYSYGDGGGAKYKVRQVQNTDVEDDMFIIALHDTNLVAELIIKDNILNVLKVGVKNDNSTDISTKINTLTENYSLFLPAGQYKVDNTINLKHSIYGACFVRDNTTDNQQTILKSSVIDKTINISGNNERAPQNIEKIKIVIDSDTTDTEVVRYNPTNQTRCYIKELSVINFSGIAIKIDDTYQTFISRGVYMDTICLFAKPYTNSIGIRSENTVSDNRYSNIEIMFAKRGIVNGATIQIDNVHIWTGGTGTDVDGWWNGTRGIDNYNLVNGTNVYIDTSLIALVNSNGGRIMIDNFTYWIDDSISGSPQYDGQICFTSNFVDSQNILINNATIYIGNRIKWINGKIKNLRLLYDTLDNFEPYSLYYCDNIDYYLNYTQDSSTTRYLPVAILQIRGAGGRGYSEINITTDAGQNALIKCSYDWQNNFVIKSNFFNKQNNYYYKIENNRVYIYLETNGRNMNVNVQTNSKSYGMFPINMNSLVNRQTKKFIGEDYILTSTTGLTQITQTQVNP